MGKVTVDMSISMDGFITGPNEDVDRLHQWLYGLASWRERHGHAGGTRDRDAEVLDEAFRTTGAILMGKRMFEVGERPWGDEPPFHMPVFVLSHEAREPLVKVGGTTFTFVTAGIDTALEQARAAAGDQDVSLAGGANLVQQYLGAGMIDEIQIHLVPVMLGEGVRLFEGLGTTQIELERTRVIESEDVTHLKFRVLR